jgi:hypothetical protein
MCLRTFDPRESAGLARPGVDEQLRYHCALTMRVLSHFWLKTRME